MGISALECFAISMRLTKEALESKDADRVNEILEEMYVNNDGFMKITVMEVCFHNEQ